VSVTAVATEDLDARTTTYEEGGTRAGSRRWTVALDLAAATADERAAAEAFAEAAVPVPLYSRHPAFPAMIARTAAVARVGLDSYTVTVGYSSRPFAARSDGTGGTGGVTGGAGIGGGGTAPNAGADGSQAAPLRPPEVYYFTSDAERVVETDSETAAEVRNAAGDRFDPPVMADWATLGIRLKFWRPASWFSPAVFGYLNQRNSAAVTIAGQTWSTKTLRVKKIDPKPVWDQVQVAAGPPPVTNLSLVYEVTVELLYDPDLHNQKTLNAGRRKKVTVGGAPRLQPILGPDGAIVQEPVPLKADGTDQIAPGASPNYVTVHRYGAMNIAALWS
jgi:hypothetical protein